MKANHSLTNTKLNLVDSNFKDDVNVENIGTKPTSYLVSNDGNCDSPDGARQRWALPVGLGQEEEGQKYSKFGEAKVGRCGSLGRDACSWTCAE